jgi:predicted Holliday junction resolvase-like endonuclease
MSGQTLLFAGLSFAAILVAVVLAMTLWRLRQTIEHLDQRMDEALKEVEMTAEDLRRTNAVVRDILLHAEKSVANVEHMTEGIRSFRKTLDTATSVLQFFAVPVLGNVAGGMAGMKAAVSHVVNRFMRKGGSHE